MKQNNIFYEWQIVRIKSREALQIGPWCTSAMRYLHWQQATITKIIKTGLGHVWDRIWIDLDRWKFIWSPNCFELISYWRNDFIL